MCKVDLYAHKIFRTPPFSKHGFWLLFFIFKIFKISNVSIDDLKNSVSIPGGVIAGIALGSTCVVTTALVLVLKHCKLLKRTKVTSLKPETH